MTNEQYYDLIVPYQDALNLFKARLDVLNHSMYGSASHPIHNIQSRIKQKQSIEEKLERMELSASFTNAKENLQDIAGARVICYFERDVELLAEQLKKTERSHIDQRKRLHCQSETERLPELSHGSGHSGLHH